MTYAKLPGLTWDGTVYENEEMGTLEALLPTGGWPTAHAPAMVGSCPTVTCSAAGSPVLMRAAQMCTSSARCCRMTVPSGWSR